VALLHGCLSVRASIVLPVVSQALAILL
jgi:hypothetical protein